ncbi:hypothetical protein [Pseudoalteromonas luteoviolacea]|uniref:hypothetical protein n=1 Tax=Pseudoalteromonas luteoviolacea TaxID=43657 RepID=UPI001B37E9C2|nr:hypothetical protein [Pseudoalteromonas luteoviolacea]MBQ4839819.1 hypothetical protein [Pseudoalteromonas luteoviolacea]
MSSNIKIASIFIMSFFSLWFWQLGMFAIPEDIDVSNMLRSWFNPGVKAFPTIVSIACFFAANYFILKNNNDKKANENL